MSNLQESLMSSEIIYKKSQSYNNVLETSAYMDGELNISFEENLKHHKYDANAQTVRYRPLHEHVKESVSLYFDDLEGDIPLNLYARVLEQVEKPMLEVIMEKTQGNQTLTAKILGINRNTLRKKLTKYCIG